MNAPWNCFTSVATLWLLQFYDGGEIGCSAIMDARTGKKWIAKMTLTLKYQDDFDPNTDPLLLPPLKCSWGQRPLPLSLCCNLSLQSWAIKVLKALRFLTPMITISFPLLLHPCPMISWPNLCNWDLIDKTLADGDLSWLPDSTWIFICVPWQS